ncbi:MULTISPECIES: NAD(P)-dependent oxidoreductase [unclassified Actinotalea]|uniref:NAD(P)-dependent oxidoreductase n=1 Tax=unclassified Actinotalea TaxID=2638618 RepID=UPI0015F5FEE5|nr:MULTISPECIES: NAD(P)-dependent oxidoreductase [unclassified Actinotalea]
MTTTADQGPTPATPYRVGVTADCLRPDGSAVFGDVRLERLTAAGLEWEIMAPESAHALTPALADGYDAVLAFGHAPFPRTLVQAAPRLKHVARFGAGYDGIDLDGLAAEGVVVTNTPLAVRRPLALSALTLLLAVAHRLVENHAAATSGRWTDRGRYRGAGVAGRTVGIVGLGGVGADLVTLLAPLGVRVLASDPFADPGRAQALGVELVPLDRLTAESDYVVLTAALTDGTRGMVDAAFLAGMRPTAHLVNVARGGLVDHAALTAALVTGRIAGAALDVLDPEPPAPDDPLLHLPNVVVTPHALCWTEDFTRDVSTSVVEALVDVAQGRVPAHVLNPDALARWRRGR